MTAYEMLSRHQTKHALRVAALMFLGALLQLLVLPCAIVTLLVDRAVAVIADAVAAVPVMVAEARVVPPAMVVPDRAA